jgi:hypothetical protein
MTGTMRGYPGEPLNAENWPGYERGMKAFLRMNHIIWTVDPIGIAPDDPAEAAKHQNQVLGLLQLSVDADNGALIANAATARIAWTTLETIYNGRLQSRVRQIKSEFDRLEMNRGEKVLSFITRVRGKRLELSKAGRLITDREVVSVILDGIRGFTGFHIISHGLEISLLDDPVANIDLNAVTNKLMTEEDRIKRNDTYSAHSASASHSVVCKYCNKVGHHEYECNKKARDNAATGSGGNGPPPRWGGGHGGNGGNGGDYDAARARSFGGPQNYSRQSSGPNVSFAPLPPRHNSGGDARGYPRQHNNDAHHPGDYRPASDAYNHGGNSRSPPGAHGNYAAPQRYYEETPRRHNVVNMSAHVSPTPFGRRDGTVAALISSSDDPQASFATGPPRHSVGGGARVAHVLTATAFRSPRPHDSQSSDSSRYDTPSHNVVAMSASVVQRIDDLDAALLSFNDYYSERKKSKQYAPSVSETGSSRGPENKTEYTLVSSTAIPNPTSFASATVPSVPDTTVYDVAAGGGIGGVSGAYFSRFKERLVAKVDASTCEDDYMADLAATLSAEQPVGASDFSLYDNESYDDESDDEPDAEPVGASGTVVSELPEPASDITPVSIMSGLSVGANDIEGRIVKMANALDESPIRGSLSSLIALDESPSRGSLSSLIALDESPSRGSLSSLFSDVSPLVNDSSDEDEPVRRDREPLVFFFSDVSQPVGALPPHSVSVGALPLDSGPVGALPPHRNNCEHAKLPGGFCNTDFAGD